jgi:16S rRNA (cytosine967-C5)-methyltransferase
VPRLQPWVRTILRLGVWQLLWSRSVPPRAACDTSVDLARRYANPGAAGYVNAVLRSVARDPAAGTFPPDDPDASPADRAAALGLRHSLPSWMAVRLLDAFGEQAEPLAAAFQEAPRTTARVNRLRTTVADLAARLREEGVDTVPSAFIPEALAIDLDGSPVARLASFREGWFMVQDEAAMLVSRVADPQPGWTVLDACAAPGGKSTHLAELMAGRGRVVAQDASAARIGLVVENAARLGSRIVEPVVRDATDPPADGERYDLVLVDAPCSGLGLLAKKPEIRLTMTEERVAALADLQARILSAAALAVKPGGRLVYSTCTLLPEEDGRQADAFLRDQAGLFEPEPFEDRIPAALAALDATVVDSASAGRLMLLPHRHGCDGFFMARFRRIPR